MAGWLMERMVERAIPSDIEDPDQIRSAEEAAENAIRHVVTIAGIVGVAVVAALAALVYGVLPSGQMAPGVSQPSASVERVGTGEATRLPPKEEADGKLQQVVMERDTLQVTVADLERRLEELAKRQPPTAGTATLVQDPEERTALHTKIKDLERQVAALTQKLQATRTPAAGAPSARDAKPARRRTTPAAAAPRRAYRCVDGRTVRDPATCSAAVSAPPERVPSAPDMYHCGDGESVRTPADCRPAGAPSSGG